MSWYAKMFKSNEVARQRNRREERRVQSDRHGPLFAQQYHMAELDKEKKIIQKELERIRQGIHKRPNHEDSRTGNGNTSQRGNHASSIFTPRQQKTHNANGAVVIEPEYSKDENNLYDAIVFLQNNPSALVPILTAHARSDAYLETLERISPRLSSENKPFVPKYLKEQVSKIEKAELLKKYTTLLHRQSPVLRKSSPLLEKSSPFSYRDSPLLGSPSKEDITQGGSPITNELLSNAASEKGDQHDGANNMDADSGITAEEPAHQSSASTLSSSKQIRQLDLAKLATDGMQNARENVSKRLTTKDKCNNDTQPAQERRVSSNEPPTVYGETKQRPADDKRPKATKAVAMFPGYDPEIYNADGTLRTMHQMPSADICWEQAQKARYIRSKEAVARDRELSVNEIFDKA